MRLLTKPPRRLQKARLDNIAIVPANRLPFKKQWQAIADGLPNNSTLIVFHKNNDHLNKTLAHIAELFKENGRRVKTYSSSK